MSAICLFMHMCVCLFVCTQWWPSRFFIFYRLRGSTTAFVSFRYILNSKQNTFSFHLLSLQSVALREKERQTNIQGERERERNIARDWVFIFTGICENLEKTLWLYWIVKSGHKSKFHPRSAPMKTKGVLAEFYWRWWMPDYLIGVNVNMPYTATPRLAASGSDWQLIYMS